MRLHKPKCVANFHLPGRDKADKNHQNKKAAGDGGVSMTDFLMTPINQPTHYQPLLEELGRLGIECNYSRGITRGDRGGKAMNVSLKL